MYYFIRQTYSCFLTLLMLGLLASCTMGPTEKQEFLMAPESVDQKGGKAEKAEEWYQSNGDGVYKLGKPYKVNGTWYFPAENWKYDEIGYAGIYSPDFDNHTTSNGEIYRKDGLTASHKTLPLPSIVRVTNLANNISIIIRVNDRGPFSNDRLLDVSERAAKMLEFEGTGPARVRIELLPEESKKAADLLMYNRKSEDRLLSIPDTSPSDTTMQEKQQSSAPKVTEETLPSIVVVQNETPEPVAEQEENGVMDEGAAGLADGKNNDSSSSGMPTEGLLALAPGAGTTPSAENSANVISVQETSETPLEAVAENGEESSTLQAPVGVKPSLSSNPIEAPKHSAIATSSMIKNPYYIQAGTFGIEGNAVKLSHKLAKFANTSITPITNGVRQLNKVEVGPFATKEDAEKILVYIKQAMGLKDAKLLKRS